MRPPSAPAAPLLLLTALAATSLAGCGGGGDSCSATPQAVEATGAWQSWGPGQWTACTLSVKAPALAADERLAVLLVNASGDDNATATVSVTGTSPSVRAPGTAPLLLAEPASPAPAVAPDRLAAPALQEASLARWLAGPGPGLAAQRARARAGQGRGAVQAAVIPATRTFCVYSLPSFTTWTRQTATLEHESAHAAYYATSDVRAGLVDLATRVRPDFWDSLDSYYEGTASARNPGGAKDVLGALTAGFGDQSDYDANGKMIFLFTDLRAKDGTGQATSFVAGYFDPNDTQPADETPGCTASGAGRGSNGADMLYLMNPVTYASMGYGIDMVIDSDLPAVMAHELQHDVLFNARCLRDGVQARCAASGDKKTTGDLWLNEGLSMVAEDAAGFGLHDASSRQRVAAYLSCGSSSHTCHETASMTAWPAGGGDPYGNYGAVHAFLRWHADQQGKVSPAAAQAFTRALVGATTDAKSAVAAASGLSFVEGSVRFASAALFSGWPTDPVPDWDFAAGTAWSPFHGRISWPSFDPLPAGPATVPLRTDGWQVLETGLGSGGDATLTVTSTAAARSTLVVARVKGRLGEP